MMQNSKPRHQWLRIGPGTRVHHRVDDAGVHNTMFESPRRLDLPRAPEAIRLSLGRIKRGAVPRSMLIGLLVLAWMLVRIPLFLVLYWLRLPVMMVCNLVSIPTLFAFLFSWYAFPDKTRMIVAFATVSFTAFVVLWAYDYVLMRLSPQDLVKML